MRIACHCVAHSFMGIAHYYIIIVTFGRQKKRHKSRAAAIATAMFTVRKQFIQHVIINTVDRV